MTLTMVRLRRTLAVLYLLLAPATAFAQDKFFDSNAVQIRYVGQGQGEPIVLLHGIGGSLDTWTDSGVLKDLARDYRHGATMIDVSRHLRDVLKTKGHEVHHNEGGGGHNVVEWRSTFADGLLALSGLPVPQTVVTPTEQRTVRDGVYADAQAMRGEVIAAMQCVNCHGPAFSGGDVAPPLAGPVFNTTWEGLPLADLFERIRRTMPQDKPGSLTRQQTADVLAYMLKLGLFPSGQSALDPSAESLARIRFVTSVP